MKTKLFLIALISLVLFGCCSKDSQTEDEPKLGRSNVEVTYDYNLPEGYDFQGLKYSGYSADVIHTEYRIDSTVEVFMAYAVYGDGNYEISVYQKIKNTYPVLLGEWSFGENQKTGVISFCVKQQEKVNLVFETKIISDLPASFSEPFSLSTIKKEAVALSSE